MNNDKLTCLVPVVIFLAISFQVEAQQPKKVPQIGFLGTGSGLGIPNTPNTEAFRRGLRELGYVEGKNIIIEYRRAEGRLERLPELAEELVRLKVDLIVANTTPAVLAAKKATQTIPIIIVAAADPIGSGLVATFARPGGNITGLSLVGGLEISGKQLELLKEAIPKLTHVAALANPANKPTAGFLKEAEQAARPLGVQLRVFEARDPNELDGAFSAIRKERPGALLVIAAPFIGTNTRIVSFATSSRLPAMYPYRESVDAGGLMSYGPNQPDLYRRAATYVDKILKGAKPAELPVEQPMKFEFVMNLKAAKQIGITIPPHVLALADKVIK